MEGFLVLLALLAVVSAVVSPVIAVAALSRAGHLSAAMRHLHRRLESLRAELKDLRRGIPERRHGTGDSPALEEPAEPEAWPGAGMTDSAMESPLPEGVAEEPAPTEAGTEVDPVALTDAPAAPDAEPTAEDLPWETVQTSNVEERLSVRLPVWIGAVSLVLAVVFLVKYTFDQGLLTPAIRLGIGALFGTALIGAGELLLRRCERDPTPPGPEGSSWIPQGLSSSGVAILYASLFGAVTVYELLGPTLGFGLMVLVTALAVALSLRHGPMVAAIGLVGGFVMPALIQTDEPRPSVLFSYLFLLEIGLVLVTGRRGWWWMTALALPGVVVWAAAWILGIDAGTLPEEHSTWVGLFLVGSAIVLALPGTPRDTRGGARTLELSLVGWIAASASLALLALLGSVVDYATEEWCLLGALAAGCIVLGRVDPRKETMPFLSLVAGLVLLAAWHDGGVEDADHVRFGLIAIAFGTLHAAGGYSLLWRARSPAIWASLAATAVVGYFLLAYWELRDTAIPLGWAVWSVVLAAACGAAAVPVFRRREGLRQASATLAALLVASTALVALAVPIELEREWIAVAWAVEIAALAWLEKRLGTTVLRYLAAILAMAVTARLLLNPAVLDYPTGTQVPWNWILYGYGLPAASLFWAASTHRGIDGRSSKSADPSTWIPAGLELAAVGLGLALLVLQVRQYFHPGELRGPVISLREWTTYSLSWILGGLALLGLWRRLPLRTVLHSGAVVGSLGLMAALLLPGFVLNPLLTGEPVGETPILNDLPYVYGLPALFGIVLACRLHRYAWFERARVSGVVSIILLFVLVSLEVRQGFQGARLDGPAPTNAEWYAYSAAWIALGLVLLAVGIATRGAVVRYASLVVMMTSVAKVFLFDTRELRNLYRVFSFLGLGVSLFLLAYLYQRFVFRRTRG